MKTTWKEKIVYILVIVILGLGVGFLTPKLTRNIEKQNFCVSVSDGSYYSKWNPVSQKCEMKEKQLPDFNLRYK